MADRAYLERLTKELTNEGKLIEAGWIGLRLAAVPLDAPAVQLHEMRNAFFAGAQHLYTSIMTIMDPGTEPTDNDLKRMEMIHKELDGFTENLVAAKRSTPKPTPKPAPETPPTLGDAPIQQETRQVMNDLGTLINKCLNQKGKPVDWGFILMVFKFGLNVEGTHRCNYISNADRKDVIILLKEQLKRFEGQPEMKGTA
jgi:hypothetical protein